MLSGIFFQGPWSGIFDKGVGRIGQFHDQSHRSRVIALFVGFGDFFTGQDSGCEQAAIVGVLDTQAGGFDKPCGTAGQIDHFTDEV